MFYVPLSQYFPEVAKRETRSITLDASSGFRLPPESYGFFELYCNEQNCDCRRVFFYVVTSQGKLEAVIAYGWESEEYYAKWVGTDDPQFVRECKGPVLNLGSPQTKNSPEILRLVKEVLIQDPAYVDRLKKHYDLVKGMGKDSQAAIRRKRHSQRHSASKGRMIRPR